MSKRLKTILQYIFFLGLGLLFAWLSVKNITDENRRQLQASLAEARHWLFIPVFAMLVLSHYLRALRWRLLIKPLGYNPGTINSFLAVLIGYLVNLGVPRLGEVMKCTLLARYEKIPADKLIGTIITERIIDSLTLLLVFGITLGIQPGLYTQLLDTLFPEGTLPKEKSYGLLSLLLFTLLAIIFLLYWLLVKKRSWHDLRVLLVRILSSVAAGVGSIRALQQRQLFILLSVCIWGLYLFAGYVGFLAFSETAGYGLREAFTILSAGSIGMIASPGGIGAYAFLVEKSMQLYGLHYSVALAFGWVLWLAQTLVIVLAGIFSFIALPWYNRRS